jgi:hypothetical protein
LNYRKNSTAIHQGETLHFAPFDGIYALFRMQDDEVVVLLLNKNETSKSIDLHRFEELNLEGKSFSNLHSDEVFTWGESLQLNNGITILTTKK